MSTSEVTPKPMAELLKEMEALVLERLHEVEITHRRMKFLLASAGFMVLLLVAAAGTILYASIRSGILGASAHSITAREFVLVDAEGTVRGSWTLSDEGAVRLLLHDGNGVPRVKLAVVEGGAPGLSLTDEVGRSRIVLGLLPDETSTLVFADQRGEARAVLGLAIDEAARLIFADREGVVRAGLGVAAGGAANLILDDEFGRLPPSGSN
jgi:hypothetical protein